MSSITMPGSKGVSGAGGGGGAGVKRKLSFAHAQAGALIVSTAAQARNSAQC